jgi:riboflavin biosynthesis pyrimidine reductase
MHTVAWYELEAGFSANFHLTESGDYFGENHSSRDISNEVDLAHLIKLRSQADAIVVGGATARAESYKPSKRFETYVISSQPQAAELHRIAFAGDAELSAQILTLKAKHARVLSECGPALLNKFLQLGALDKLFLTVSFQNQPSRNAAQKSAESVLELDGYRLENFEIIQNSALTSWRRA